MNDNILVAEKRVHMIACLHPFLMDRVTCMMPEEATVAAMMRHIGFDPMHRFARVFIDDRLIEQAQWEVATAAAGQLVMIRAVPAGGGGGQGKDALRVVAMIGIVVAAYFTGGAAAAALGPGGVGILGIGGFSAASAGAIGAGFSATFTIAGSLALNGLIPQPLPRRARPRPIADQGQKAAA